MILAIFPMPGTSRTSTWFLDAMKNSMYSEAQQREDSWTCEKVRYEGGGSEESTKWWRRNFRLPVRGGLPWLNMRGPAVTIFAKARFILAGVRAKRTGWVDKFRYELACDMNERNCRQRTSAHSAPTKGSPADNWKGWTVCTCFFSYHLRFARCPPLQYRQAPFVFAFMILFITHNLSSDNKRHHAQV